MAVIPKSKKGLVINKNSGIIEMSAYWGSWTEIYEATIDLRGFIKGFATLLSTNKDIPFTDVLGKPESGKFFEDYAQASEFPKAGDHYTRRNDMFEKKAVISRFDGGVYDFEVSWLAKAKTKYSGFGWVVFKLDLQVRNIKDVEVVDGDKKKVMQKAKWEFRNTLTYYNSYIPKYLHTVPIIKDSAELQRLMVDHVYFGNIERDLIWVETKVKPLIQNFIFKHMK